MKSPTFLILALTISSSLAHAGEAKKLGEGQCFDLKQSVIASLPQANAGSRKSLEADIATLSGQCAQPQLAYLLKRELGRRVASVISPR